MSVQNVWGRIPEGLRKRPFDVYLALILVVLGIWGLFDSNFPEVQQDTINFVLLTITELYLVAAGIMIITGIIRSAKKCSIFNFYSEFFGWVFIAAANVSICAFQIYNALVSDMYTVTDIALYWFIFFVFSCFATAAIIRATDMWIYMRSLRKGRS